MKRENKTSFSAAPVNPFSPERKVMRRLRPAPAALIAVSACVLFFRGVMAEDRDPFVSIIDLLEQQTAGEEKMKVDLSQVELKGIIWSAKKMLAVINEELVMAGDNWQGFKVEAIDKNSVTLSYAGKPFKIFVEEPAAAEKKKPAVKLEAPETNEEFTHPGEEGMFPGGPKGFPPDKNFGFPERNNEKSFNRE